MRMNICTEGCEKERTCKPLVFTSMQSYVIYKCLGEREHVTMEKKKYKIFQMECYI